MGLARTSTWDTNGSGANGFAKKCPQGRQPLTAPPATTAIQRRDSPSYVLTH